MVEPVKNSFRPDVPVRIAGMIERVHPAFPSAEFIAFSLEGYDELELTPRARRISDGFARYLPGDRSEAIRILVASLGPVLERLQGMEPFIYLPHVFFVAAHGLGCLEESLQAQYELTQRFTAEFSIRVFIERHPVETLARLRQWATDPSAHVRRLVSEGTRPRLPWAPRLRRFMQDPELVIDLLELLKDDPELYVRRSVANNLNDIAKDNPDLIVDVCGRWLSGASEERRWLVKHGLRSLIKQGHPGALALLGFGKDSAAAVETLTVVPKRVSIGERVLIEARIRNEGASPERVLVDYRVHFVKANGSTSAKVFKGAAVQLAPGETSSVKKTVSVAQQSTRTHYPGRHRVEAVLNGRVMRSTWFTVAA